MIKYKLNCKKCKNIFDSWFASSKEFEKLKKMNLINCHSCNSLNIEKSIMAPRISSKTNTYKQTSAIKMNKVKSKINKFQNFIKKNFEYVGDNFTYEARSIHYGDKKSKKAIYGRATSKEIKDLKDEGIETTTIPWLNNNEN
tara:strand:+ start:2341 stop:2766 length:426 start_codon:yes stop_codon:yes gene_type:complete